MESLESELRRMVALAEPNSTLAPDAISAEILGALPRVPAVSGQEIAVPLQDKLLPTLAHIEREMIKAALRDHHGKVDAVAKALGISRKGLYLKRQRLGLERRPPASRLAVGPRSSPTSRQPKPAREMHSAKARASKTVALVVNRIRQGPTERVHHEFAGTS